jgi:mono/diheme cytochrome c family protein
VNIKARRIRIVLGAATGLTAAGAIWLLVAWAKPAARQAPDYQGYDLARPWYGKQKNPWFLDMVNQPSIKPQEQGTFQNFPQDSVPRGGSEPYISAEAKSGNQLARDVMPKNPVQATPRSLANGKLMYETYCAACHANNGMGMTPVTLKGIPPIPVAVMVPALSEAHLYNKALYGGAIMPAYGFQTSARDRWDIVNYMKSAQFGK